MAERTFEVKTVGVEYVCERCSDGLMLPTGIYLPTDPPRWRHKCDACGCEDDLLQKYPTVRWERARA